MIIWCSAANKGEFTRKANIEYPSNKAASSNISRQTHTLRKQLSSLKKWPIEQELLMGID